MTRNSGIKGARNFKQSPDYRLNCNSLSAQSSSAQLIGETTNQIELKQNIVKRRFSVVRGETGVTREDILEYGIQH